MQVVEVAFHSAPRFGIYSSIDLEHYGIIGQNNACAARKQFCTEVPGTLVLGVNGEIVCLSFPK